MAFLRFLFTTGLIALLIWAPATAQDADGPSGAISAERDSALDGRIETRIREILQEIGGYDEISVSVSEGVVTLQGTTESATAAANLVALVTRLEGVVTIRNEVEETADIRRRLNPAMERFWGRVRQLGIMAPLLGIAIASFGALTFAGVFLARRRWPWDRIAPNAFIADLYRQIVMLLFSFVGIVVALDIMDASALLSTFIGAAGLVGLAIGFAVRDTVENYIASIFLSIRQPFRPNDTVDIDGTEGKVIRLTSRATILLSFDGNHIRIPNATVFKAKIVNYSENAERRLMFRIGIEADNDLHKARQVIVETMQGLPFVLEVPAVQSWIESLSGGTVEIVVTVWVDQRDTSILLARGEAIRFAKLALEAAGITLDTSDYNLSVNGFAPIAEPGRTGTDRTGTDRTGTGRTGTGRTGPAPSPAPLLTPELSAQELEIVRTDNEAILDAMIETERARDDKQDLLTPDSPHE